MLYDLCCMPKKDQCKSIDRKAACSTLVKLTPVVNFINVKGANFTYESLFSSYILALNKHLYKKHVRKTLMKLTPAA